MQVFYLSSVNIYVLCTCLSLSADRGYVYLWPSDPTNVSSLLHHKVELQVELDAHPAPTVIWTKDNQSIARDAALTRTTRLTGSRCVESHMVGNINHLSDRSTDYSN